MSSAPEPLSMTVDGQDFLVRARAGQSGVYDFEWLTGPSGYGFTVARSDRSPLGHAEAEEAIRGFLAQSDPATGLID
ncbi:hypothetical protein [Plantactinospora endophytica]|uniref:Uncharacterized protein n=1 Tax=Plantactinospora endophytica TaxID=673535 RepID=A0ABQ4E3N7_9ACTN|nr:hypothetical protein [Plantactinospora endophytica]GIG89295.1 hypothetical protein Pen02_42310 [Plantactinospora endophytica]